MISKNRELGWAIGAKQVKGRRHHALTARNLRLLTAIDNAGGQERFSQLDVLAEAD